VLAIIVLIRAFLSVSLGVHRGAVAVEPRRQAAVPVAGDEGHGAQA
jgi:hypothetical protein